MKNQNYLIKKKSFCCSHTSKAVVTFVTIFFIKKTGDSRFVVFAILLLVWLAVRHAFLILCQARHQRFLQTF